MNDLSWPELQHYFQPVNLNKRKFAKKENAAKFQAILKRKFDFSGKLVIEKLVQESSALKDPQPLTSLLQENEKSKLIEQQRHIDELKNSELTKEVIRQFDGTIEAVTHNS